jgi:hypothetical protein
MLIAPLLIQIRRAGVQKKFGAKVLRAGIDFDVAWIPSNPVGAVRQAH